MQELRLAESELIIFKKALNNPKSLSNAELNILWDIDTTLPIFCCPPEEASPMPHYIAANGEGIPLLLRMLEAKKPVDLKTLLNFEASTLLLLTAKFGPVGDSVTAYILNNIDAFGGSALLNMQDHQRRTALHYLYLYGNVALIERMCVLGADTSLLDHTGERPEQYLFEGTLQKVTAIGKEAGIECRRSIDARSNFLTELGTHAKYGQLKMQNGRLTIEEALLQHPDDLQIVRDPENTIYIVEPSLSLYQPITPDHRQALLAHYAHIHTRRRLIDLISDNREAAKQHFKAEITQTLVKQYSLASDSLVELEKGIWNALMQQNRKDVEAFITAGVDPKIPSPFNGKTLLHYAVEENSREHVDFLMRHGANAHAQDGQGETPLALAMRIQPSLVKALQPVEEKEAVQGRNTMERAIAPLPASFLIQQGFIAQAGNRERQQQSIYQKIVSSCAIL